MWKTKECLCDYWKVMSTDPITGANQTSGAYWKRTKTEFDEHKFTNKEYAKGTWITMKMQSRIGGVLYKRWPTNSTVVLIISAIDPRVARHCMMK